MSFGEDEEIMQDFLVEAGEILESLSEQLVELEQRPDDKDLLNAIFRGFHTVKGGAGFLSLENMVKVCHITENLFDMLRRGERQATPDVMDVVLQALDTVNDMFSELQNGEQPSPADPGLLEHLDAVVKGAAATSEAPEAMAPVEQVQEDTEQDITDAEFECMLDALAEKEEAPATASDDFITDDEFEDLLDQLHGAGQFVAPAANTTPVADAASDDGMDLFGEDDGLFGDDDGLFGDDDDLFGNESHSSVDTIGEQEFEEILTAVHGSDASAVKQKLLTEGIDPPPPKVAVPPQAAKSSAPQAQTKVNVPESAVATPSSTDDDLITDDEFEKLLDQLHGAGKGPTVSSKPEQEIPIPKAVAPAPVPKSAPAAKAAKPSTEKAPVPTSKAAPKQAPKDTTPVETTVRVDTQRLDDIMNMVGELVLVRNRLVRLGVSSSDEEMAKAVANLDVVTGDLQTSVMKTRMQPIKKVFGRFPRVVRDLARSLRKEITLELVGEETDLDKNLVEALADPLVHLVRNSVDHGIEAPDIREKAGKNRMGTIILAAEQEGDHILLSITDDGGGMDPNKLRAIAVEKGLYDEESVARLTDTEAFNLIFMPGFSTKKEISDVSGRGVGMDVVKTKITQLNGSLEINSELGVGTRINIKVPLTLAIMPTLMIMLGNQTFALPLVSVNEIFHMDLRKTHRVDGREVINIRNNSIPLFFLKRWLLKRGLLAEESANDDPFAHVVIVTVGTQRVGFVVDQLIGQEEVVIKPLGKMLQGTPGMSGATITGDGRIALILDVPGLLKRYA
jgi:two-component system, chemotaxis family, sensor kinase CheA